MSTLADLDILVDANPDAFSGLASAYQSLLDGVPSINGFVFLINNAVATNFGSNNPSIVFNMENKFINLVNSLVQGNATAAANFDSLLGDSGTLQDKLVKIYNAYVPAENQTVEGRAFFSRAEAQAFYTSVAAERGVAGENGAAIVGLASLLKILVTSDIGLGAEVNDLNAAIDAGTAQLPEGGSAFTDIVVAIGANDVFDLTPGTDIVNGGATDTIINGEVDQTALLPIQTLNNTDQLNGGAGDNTLNAQLVNAFTVPALLTNIQTVNLDGAPGFIVPPVVLDVINANAITTINFRAPANNIQVNNVSTTLTNIGISDDVGGNVFTINHTGTGAAGAADIVTLTVRNLEDGTGGDTILNVGGSGGYETYNLVSNGPVGGVMFTNDLDINDGSTQTINVTGNASLEIEGTGLNISHLQTFNAAGLAGNDPGGNAVFVDADFTGGGTVTVTGSAGADILDFTAVVQAAGGVQSKVTVNGGAGNDAISFSAAVDATAQGGTGDDTFTFLPDGANNSSFTVNDSVDGGDGDDTIVIRHTGTGAFLAAGVGAGITNVEQITHVGDIAAAGNNLTVDMAESGSAKILNLNGFYDLGSITTINNLENDDFVVVNSANGIVSDLRLNYSAPAALNIFNLELVGENVGVLRTMALTEIVNIEVSGTTNSAISNASQINGNVVVTGTVGLTLGNSAANAYDFDNGVVDISDATANDVVWLGAGNQTLLDGAGNDFIWATGFGAANFDVVNLAGGQDTVGFNDDSLLGTLLSNTHQVNGFSIADDEVAINDALFNFQLDSSNGVPLTPASIPTMVEVGPGAIVDFSLTNFNFLKFTYNAATGATADALFSSAIGAGSVNVAGLPDLLAAAYDSVNGNLVLFEINDFNGVIDTGDSAFAIANIAMSYSDFLAFGPDNLNYSFL